jgi:hypothetical protein
MLARLLSYKEVNMPMPRIRRMPATPHLNPAESFRL